MKRMFLILPLLLCIYSCGGNNISNLARPKETIEITVQPNIEVSYQFVNNGEYKKMTIRSEDKVNFEIWENGRRIYQGEGNKEFMINNGIIVIKAKSYKESKINILLYG
jgi:hypothetical protein